MNFRWRVAALSSLLLGLTVGLPYYAIAFFYDYWETSYGWSRGAIMLGLPLGTFVTLILGPLYVRRLSPRHSITGGAVLVAASLAGFGLMPPNLLVYYGVWILYMAGWSFAGPLAHQILLSRLFPEKPGPALALAYFGISLLGALSVVLLARPLTLAYGFPTALLILGGIVMLAVPLAHWGLPATKPDHHARSKPAPVVRNRAFWLLLTGTTSSIAGIGGISQHLKLILREVNYPNQARLDAVYGLTVMLMLLTVQARLVRVVHLEHQPLPEARRAERGFWPHGGLAAAAARAGLVAGPDAVPVRASLRPGDERRFAAAAPGGGRALR
jgi:MFS family permease